MGDKRQQTASGSMSKCQNMRLIPAGLSPRLHYYCGAQSNDSQGQMIVKEGLFLSAEV